MKKLLRLRAVVAMGLLLLSGGVVLEVAIRNAKLPAGLGESPPETLRLLDRKGTEIAVLPNDLARDCIPLRFHEMGYWLPLATIAVEDRRFHTHPGVDPKAIAAALLRAVTSGRPPSGASTITQQLVKMSSDHPRRKLGNKIREALVALRLEREWSKEQILQAYLNRLDYGNRRIGPEAAAVAYFGKSTHELSLQEALLLAGLPQSPTRLNPWKNPAGAQRRYERNARRVAESGMLPLWATAEILLSSTPVPLRHDPPQKARHFVGALKTRGLLDGLSGRVSSTLDAEIQNGVERLLTRHLGLLTGFGITDAAVVVLENETGAVRALASHGTARFINAADIPRSSGSTLKPFLYAAAMEEKVMTAATVLPDTPDAIREAYSDYDPKNYSRRYLGPVRVREALGNSLNVPAVVALSQLGARRTFAKIRRWGFTLHGGFDVSGAGFILGNAPVTTLELASAYASMARGGIAQKPKFLAMQNSGERVPVVSPEVAAIVTDILCDNRARAISFGSASPLALPWRTAAKTGTSSGFRDAWCAGFNRDHTVVVWSGALDGRPLPEVLAIRSSAPLWAAVMRLLYSRGDASVPHPSPNLNLVHTDVDPVTGLLPRPGNPVIREYFLPGTEPRESAASWYEGDTLLLPPSYAGWCASPQNTMGARVRNDRLKILFPREGAVFSVSRSISVTRQALRPLSNLPGTSWWLNGIPLGGDTIPLSTGTHTLTARSEEAEASVSFRVE